MSRPTTTGLSAASGSADAVPADRLPLSSAVLHEAWRFLRRLAIWYVLAMALWFPIGVAYRHGLVALGNALFSFAPAACEISFRPMPRAAELGLNPRVDLAVLVHQREWLDAQRRPQSVVAKPIVTFWQPYAATAFLLALFGATRLSWRVRLGRAAVALVVLHALMSACVAIDVVYALAGQGALAGISRGGIELVAVLHATITDWPAGVLIVPLMLWIFANWPRRLAIKPSSLRIPPA